VSAKIGLVVRTPETYSSDGMCACRGWKSTPELGGETSVARVLPFREEKQEKETKEGRSRTVRKRSDFTFDQKHTILLRGPADEDVGGLGNFQKVSVKRSATSKTIGGNVKATKKGLWGVLAGRKLPGRVGRSSRCEQLRKESLKTKIVATHSVP